MHPYEKYFPVRCADDRLDVVSFLHRGLTVERDRVIFEFGDDAWTVRRFARHVAAMQSWLAEQGLIKGDRVAVMLGNSPGHIALVAALMLSGLVWVPVNTRQKAVGLQYVIDHCRPNLLIADGEYAELFSEALRGTKHQCVLVDLPNVWTASEGEPRRHDVQPLDPLCIIYTSGTTGAPKGVLFTHRMMRIAGEAAMMVANAGDGDVMFMWEPLCHIGGAQMLVAPFLRRVKLHIVDRFSASRFWGQVSAANATHLHYLGGILEILMQVPLPPRGTHSLRTAWGAGLAAQSFSKACDMFEVDIRECYGMTECSSFATVNESRKPGSIGRPLPWLKIDLLDDSGQSVAVGVTGEMVISSDIEGVFLPGYLDNAEATTEALRNGTLHTGDYARVDADGDLIFVGRATDSMRIRGENVSAWEIERVLAMHPAIQACAAVGVKSEIGEQDVLLYVRPRDGHSLQWNMLAQWAGEQLASYQLPRYYKHVDEFEVTPSERIKKNLLSRDTSDAWDRLAQEED
ncbi:AMP-binding protein [Burkholderia contaminans]|uniref:AMP-dependent synthetase n=1 Tax=Burkholderia contaminans TaxID=488447 RepID=A0A3N8PUF2_9BURK|nr:AMP-binding protein [Burkholderia contaminans]RQT14945.1 AMP-dependent synthetase [Burkholderia contaminans]